MAVSRAETAEMQLNELRRSSRLAAAIATAATDSGMNPRGVAVDLFDIALTATRVKASSVTSTAQPPPPPPPPTPPPPPPPAAQGLYLPKLKLRMPSRRNGNTTDEEEESSSTSRSRTKAPATGERERKYPSMSVFLFLCVCLLFMLICCINSITFFQSRVTTHIHYCIVNCLEVVDDLIHFLINYMCVAQTKH